MALTHSSGFINHDYHHRLRQILSHCAQQFGVSRASIWRLNEQGDAIYCTLLCTPNAKPEEGSAELSINDYPNYFAALLERRIIHAPAAQTDPRTQEFARLYLAPLDIRSLVNVPIFSAGKLYGVLCFEQVAKQRSWDVAELSYAASAADCISLINEQENWLAAKQQLELTDRSDPLTGMENRLYFCQRLEQDIAQHQYVEQLRAVIMIGLDAFTKINDLYGLQAADDCLVVIAERLALLASSSQLKVARVGGDCFAIWLPGLDAEDDLQHIIDATLALLAEPVLLKQQPLAVSASVGVYTYSTATYSKTAKQKTPPLRCAEVAMQRAKSMARGAAVHFDPEWIKQLDQQRLREEEFVHALENGQITAHFQPMVCAESGKIVGLETLARWQHPERGMISPADFLPLAAELGLMCRVGIVMLRHAFQGLSEAQKAGHNLQWVSVNLAADQLYDTSLVAELERLLEEFNVASEKIELELVEELICQDSELIRSQLKAISELGFRFAIDDFGTGYSSLSRLKYLPVAKLKVDKTFVDGLPHAEDDKNIIRSIIGLAKGMGLQLVSEGVEHQAQAQWLNTMGCDYLQGYLFAKPQSLVATLALLSQPYDFLLEQREPWFNVSMDGRLMEVTAGGIWSQQTVDQLHREVEALVTALPAKDWCALVDGRDWQPGSLQVQAGIKNLAEHFINTGLKKSAYLSPDDSLSAYQVELMTPKKNGYQRRIFADREAAVAWLFNNSEQQLG